MPLHTTTELFFYDGLHLIIRRFSTVGDAKITDSEVNGTKLFLNLIWIEVFFVESA